ncbi:M56 family metallopeptidase [Telluribacter sp.]|jgi:beta-lactamase regulating signal transducer with metallopeptidase domain|uniref:M56 family metallopeptidase n=1 Tax=Telluribacter sp. TaxID=1978767 RepID=UPI002E0E56B0|nr:M56 family metallopeptidase [Telluribacter sp.]
MKIIFNLFSETLVGALGWTLLHALWQGTLLAVVAAFGFYVFRNRPAQVRYGLGIGLLASQVLASLATFAYYYLNLAVTPVAAAVSSTSVTASGAASVLLWQPVELSLAAQVRLWVNSHLTELVVCWLVGAGLLLLRFVGSWLYVEYLRSGAVLVADRAWRNRFSILTAKLNITGSIELYESTRILTPMVIGALSPVVLVPVGLLTGFSPAEVEAILVHELAHIRRHDYLVNLLQSFVEVVFFFHPALWWISNRVRTEREHCCDDIAISISGDRVSLAHALVRVAEWQSNPKLAVAFASKKPVLLQRIRRVVGIAPKPVQTWTGLPVLLVLAGMLIGVSVYAVERKPEKKPGKTTKATTSKAKDIPYLPVAYADTTIEVEEEAEVDMEEVEMEDLDLNIDIDMEEMPAMSYNFNYNFNHDWQFKMNDTLQEKLEAFHRKIEALQQQMEPLHRRMDELHLNMEKFRFEQERFGREQEKIEWKKDKVMEAREKLIQKRAELMHPNPKAAKLAEAEVEKQLASIEQQIKAQEQEVTQLNAQLAEARKQAEVADEPARKTEMAMEELSQQMEVLGRKMELEARGMEKYLPTPPPPPPAPRATPAPNAPRAPKKAGATVKGTPPRPARPAVAPVPPPPPAKKKVN